MVSLKVKFALLFKIVLVIPVNFNFKISASMCIKTMFPLNSLNIFDFHSLNIFVYNSWFKVFN